VERRGAARVHCDVTDRSVLRRLGSWVEVDVFFVLALCRNLKLACARSALVANPPLWRHNLTLALLFAPGLPVAGKRAFVGGILRSTYGRRTVQGASWPGEKMDVGVLCVCVCARVDADKAGAFLAIIFHLSKILFLCLNYPSFFISVFKGILVYIYVVLWMYFVKRIYLYITFFCAWRKGSCAKIFPCFLFNWNDAVVYVHLCA